MSFAFIKNRYSTILFDFFEYIYEYIDREKETHKFDNLSSRQCKKTFIFRNIKIYFRVRFDCIIKILPCREIRETKKKMSCARYRSSNDINHPCNNYTRTRKWIRGQHVTEKYCSKKCCSIEQKSRTSNIVIDS